MTDSNPWSRRQFLTAAAASVLAAPAWSGAPPVYPGGSDLIRVGLVGCGGRGTGAAADALRTEGPVKLTAVADVFPERVAAALANLTSDDLGLADRVDVPESRRFTGFEGAARLIASPDVDLVLLATPPHFRPEQIKAAVDAGKHLFVEKPCAVDGPGVRMVLEAGEEAAKKGLTIVSGLQRHFQNGYVEAMKRAHAGELGDIVSAHCYWNMGSLWMKPRQAGWSDLEWQLRNWLYFTWLSGDHIVEQHVHNLDVINWAKGAHPVRCFGVGGRTVRTDPSYGHIYDHHAVHYEYADGTPMFSMCRQWEGCEGKVSEHLVGTKGRANLSSEGWSFQGAAAWKHSGANNNPYQSEHDHLMASIRGGLKYNAAQTVAEATLTGIMGRMATYTGRVVTWDEALTSEERLGPPTMAFGPLATPRVPSPGI